MQHSIWNELSIRNHVNLDRDFIGSEIRSETNVHEGQNRLAYLFNEVFYKIGSFSDSRT